MIIIVIIALTLLTMSIVGYILYTNFYKPIREEFTSGVYKVNPMHKDTNFTDTSCNDLNTKFEYDISDVLQFGGTDGNACILNIDQTIHNNLPNDIQEKNPKYIYRYISNQSDASQTGTSCNVKWAEESNPDPSGVIQFGDCMIDISASIKATEAGSVSNPSLYYNRNSRLLPESIPISQCSQNNGTTGGNGEQYYSCPQMPQPHCISVQKNNPTAPDYSTPGETGRCCEYVQNIDGNITSMPDQSLMQGGTPVKLYYYWADNNKAEWTRPAKCLNNAAAGGAGAGAGAGGAATAGAGGAATAGAGGAGAGGAAGAGGTGGSGGISMAPETGPNTLYSLFMDFFSQTPNDIVNTLMVANEMKTNKELENQAKSLKQLDKIQKDLGNLTSLTSPDNVVSQSRPLPNAQEQTYGSITMPDVKGPSAVNSVWTVFK